MELRFNNNQIGNKDLEEFAVSLSKLNSLRCFELYIRYNQISNIAELATAISKLQLVTLALDLRDNQISKDISVDFMKILEKTYSNDNAELDVYF